MAYNLNYFSVLMGKTLKISGLVYWIKY